MQILCEKKLNGLIRAFEQRKIKKKSRIREKHHQSFVLFLGIWLLFNYIANKQIQEDKKTNNILHRLFAGLNFLFQQQAPSDISKIGNGLERLKKRMGNYRHHHTECGPRFDQTFNGACEQQSVETVILQKRFLENKAKKAAKKADKKQPENASLAGNLQSSVHVVS